MSHERVHPVDPPAAGSRGAPPPGDKKSSAEASSTGYVLTSSPGPTPASVYVPISSARIVAGTAMTQAQTLSVQVEGVGNIPSSSQVTAVALNVTVVSTTASGYLEGYTTGGTVTDSGIVSFAANSTGIGAAMVLVPSSSGYVSFYNSAGSLKVYVDTEGYYTTNTSSGYGYVPITSTRLVDSRSGSGNTGTPLQTGPLTSTGGIGGTSGGTYTFVVAGGVSPAPFGVSSVAVNVAATNPQGASYVVAYPAGYGRPGTASLNMSTNGQDVSNLVQVAVGTCSFNSSEGCVSFYLGSGSLNLVVDLEGYYTSGGTNASAYTAIPGTRINNTGSPSTYIGGFGPIGNQDAQTFTVTGTVGATSNEVTVPSNATAVALELTGIGMTLPGNLRAYPASAPTVPLAASLNYNPSASAVSNLVFVAVGAGGKIDFFNDEGTGTATGSAPVGLVVDLVGWFTPIPQPPPPTSQGTTPYLGLENWWSYVTRPLGSGGTAEVNAADGNLVVRQQDSTQIVGEGRLGFELERAYNSEDPTAYTFPGSFGAGWTLNVGEADQLIGSGVGTSGVYFQPPGGSPTAADQVPNPLDVVLVDQDGTHHTFTPGPVTVNGAVQPVTAASILGSLSPLLTDVEQGNPNVSIGTNATICADQIYNPPPGVHLSMWRYVVYPGQAASQVNTCAPNGNETTLIAGYAGERPDGLRFEWAPTGELVSLTTRAGDQLAYRYDSLPALSSTPSPLGRLRYVVESSAYNPATNSYPCAPTSQSLTPPAGDSQCRSYLFTYSSDTSNPCPVDSGMASSICVTDPASRQTRYDFNQSNAPHGVANTLLSRVDNPDGSTLSYQYGTTCSSSDGASATQLCSATDARGDTTDFTYKSDPQAGQSEDAAAGHNVIATLVDRRGTTTTFSYSGPSTMFADTFTGVFTGSSINVSGACNTTSTANCEQTEYTAIDTAGRVGELDQGTPAASPPCAAPSSQHNATCALQVTLLTWDTSGTTCRSPDNVVDNELCEEKRLALNDTETGQSNGIKTADGDTTYAYAITGDVLAEHQRLTSTSTLDATYGYALQFWGNGGSAISTASYSVTGGGANPTANFTAAPTATLFTLSDPTQKLSPNGNAAGANYTPYLTSYVDDASASTAPNTLQSSSGDPGKAQVCSPIHANTGVLCETDAPADPSVITPAGVCSRSGQVACTTYVYDGYGEKTQMTTPLVNAGSDSGSYHYVYFAFGAKDLTGQTSAAGWLQAVLDPTAGFSSTGGPTTATGNFVAYGYDQAGDVVRTWDRNATTSAAQPVSCYPSFGSGCTQAGGFSQALYGAASSGSCTPTVSSQVMPWRYLLMSVDQLGDITCYKTDANGNQTAVTPPRGVIDTAHNYTTTQNFDADDNLNSKTVPAGASDPSLGSVAATTAWSYDGLESKISETDPAHSSSSNDTPQTASVYDAANRLVATYMVRSDNSNYGASTCTQNPSGLPSSISSTAYVCVTRTVYDGLSNPVQTTDATGAVTTNTFDAVGRKTKVVAPGTADVASPETDTVYDADSNVVATCAPRAFTEGGLASGGCSALASGGTGDYYSTYTAYNPTDKATSVTHYRVPANTKDGSVNNPTTLVTTTSYDADANQVAQTDPRANKTTWTYNVLDRKTALSTPRSSGVSETNQYGYDPSGDTTSLTSPAGRTTEYTYDADLRLVDTIEGYQPSDNSGAYDAASGANVRTRQIHDADGNLVAVLPPQAFTNSVTSPDDSYVQAWDIDTDGRPTAQYSPRYGADGISDPGIDGGAQSTDCATSNRPANVVAAPSQTVPAYPSGVAVCVTRAGYDADGDLTRLTEASAAESSNRYLEYTYSDDGLKVGLDAASPAGAGSRVDYSFGFDGDRRPTTTTDPSGFVTATVYNPDGSTYQSEQNAQPDETGFLASPSFVTATDHYDANGEQTSTLNPLSETASTVYNSDGTKASTADTGGNVTSYGYDSDGNATTVTSPDANAKAANNPNGLSTQQGYTYDNLLAWSAVPTSQSGSTYRQTSYIYDGDGNQTSADTFTADGAPNTADPLAGFPKDTGSGSDLGAVTTSWDAAGRQSSQTGRGGTDKTATTYNAAGDPTQIAETGTSTNTITASYYLDGLLYQTGDGTRTQTDAYDGTDALTARSDAPASGGGATVTTTNYNDAELPATSTDPEVSASATSFAYNSDGLAKSEADTNGDTVQLAYYANEALDTEQLTNSNNTSLPLPEWSYTYDNLGRITAQDVTCYEAAAPSSPVTCPGAGSTTGTWDTNNFSYSYDTAGRLSGFTDGSTNQAIAYDPSGNRTQDGSTFYFYEPDNSLCASASTQPSACNTQQYQYDSAGRLTGDSCTSYSYDGFDRTITANIPASAPCAQPSNGYTPSTATYTYDGLGRQASHTANVSVGNLPANAATTISYDDLTSQVADETSQIVTTSYQLGPDGTALAVADGTAADTQYLTPDGNNSIATGETSTGAVACATRYDPFGDLQQHTQNTSATNTCSFGNSASDLGYQTARRDQTTGTYQYGTRTYDPTKAGFTTPDQYLGGTSGQNTSVNVDPLTQDTYTYVNGDPINFDDPNGHCTIGPIHIGKSHGNCFTNAFRDIFVGAASQSGSVTGETGLVLQALGSDVASTQSAYARQTNCVQFVTADPSAWGAWKCGSLGYGQAENEYGQTLIVFTGTSGGGASSSLACNPATHQCSVVGNASLFLGATASLATLAVPAAPPPVSRGGVGPVNQGKAGVNFVENALGDNVQGSEITIYAGGERARPDLFANVNGRNAFIEVKTGPGAALTPQQEVAYPAIRATGGVPAGSNAAAVPGDLLEPGTPIGPTPVYEIYLPNPVPTSIADLQGVTIVGADEETTGVLMDLLAAAIAG